MVKKYFLENYSHFNVPNQLKNERSPYLKHEDNPVEWYPWSKISLDIAKKQKNLYF